MDAAILTRAHDRAQRRFAAMIRARSWADKSAPATRLYVQAERLIDALLGEAQQPKVSLACCMTANDAWEAAAWAASARGRSMPGGQSGWSESELRWAAGDR